ncbi:hypothetical protein BgiMline_015298, partial [Biomphalaria glabrata]
GPVNLQPAWKLQNKNSIYEENYPYSENITNTVLLSAVASGCTIYTYTSVLQFTLQETDDGNEYICLVFDGNIEQSRKMFTLGVSPAPSQHYVGDTFNITCDVTKFSRLPAIPSQDFLISLSLWRQTSGETAFTQVAEYTPFHTTQNSY